MEYQARSSIIQQFLKKAGRPVDDTDIWGQKIQNQRKIAQVVDEIFWMEDRALESDRLGSLPLKKASF